MNLQTLGKYHILEELGRGGFATIYRAEDTTLGREVALKILHPQLLTDPGWVERFHREARAIARLRHPHIVTIYEIAEADERLYIAMDLLTAGSVHERLATRGRFTWDETLAILRQVADALDYAHGEGVLHRDLKPANILLDPRVGAVLTDFGFAKLVGESSMSLSLSGGVMGTPAYIAPEIWDGHEPTPQSDIYALGCVVYELLMGERLFDGKTPSVVMRKHLIDGPRFSETWPEETPPGIETVLRKALARTPGERYASAGELLAALAQLAAEKQRGREEAEAQRQHEIAAAHAREEAVRRAEEERQQQAVEEQARSEAAHAAEIQREMAAARAREETARRAKEEHQQQAAEEQARRDAARKTKTEWHKRVPVWIWLLVGLAALALGAGIIRSALRPPPEYIVVEVTATPFTVVEATNTPQPTATPNLSITGMPLPQAEILSAPRLYTRVRIHLSTTSDWTTITTLDDTCLRHAEVTSKEGNLVEEWTSPCGFGITQSLENAERGESCAKTVEFYLDRLSIEDRVHFQIARGDYGATQVEIFAKDGTMVRREMWDGIISGDNLYDFVITAEDFGEWNALPSVSTIIREDEILWSDDFANRILSGWKARSAGGLVTAKDGLVHLTGRGEWDAFYRVDYSLGDGTGALVSFKADDEAYSEIFVNSGGWETPDYRQWGLSIVKNQVFSESYQGDINEQEWLFKLYPGVWYQAWLEIEDDGVLVALVWERDNPDMAVGRRETKGEDWARLEWHFAVQVFSGVVELDDYYEFSSRSE